MRSLVFAASLLCLAAVQSPAWAEDYTDHNNGFHVVIPDGWTKSSPANAMGGINIVLRSPRFDTTRGSCPLSGTPVSGTQSMTQEDLNKELEAAIDAQFWRTMFAGSGLTVEVDEAHSERRGARRVFFATLRVARAGAADKVARIKAALHPTPGHLAAMSCGVWVGNEADEQADIATVLASFEPAKVEIIASARSPMVRTLSDRSRASWLAPPVAALAAEVRRALER